MSNYLDQRRHLDALFFVDSAVSLVFGAVALLTPHGILQKFIGGSEFGVWLSKIRYITIISYSIITHTLFICSLIQS